jgi:acyl-CoA dehydrogenase
VTTRPITLISGKSPFCETFFDNVRVEKENLIGTLNRGWDVAKALLAHERTMIGAMGDMGRPVSQVAVDSLGLDETGRLDEPMLRAKIAELEIDVAAFRLSMERVGDQVKAKQVSPAIASMLKYYGSELNKRRHELAMAAGGSDALEWESERSKGGTPAREWLRTKANSIEGGTSEVQLNIIAKHLLQLPGA